VENWTVVPHAERRVDPMAVLRLSAAPTWWTRAEVERLLTLGPAAGAWVGDDLIGFARADGDERVEDVVVEDLVVEAAFRDRGVGSALVDALLHRGPRWKVVQTTPAAAADVVRAYLLDVVSRFHGRPGTDDEVASAWRDEPSDDLIAPTGGLFVVRTEGLDIGCGGVRLVDADTAELTKVFVRPGWRRQGVAALLVAHLEAFARARGRRTVRLDTRTDLVEARRLYRRLGYVEVAPFNADPYAQHWFAKEL
jgi:ribosomal protein S18 acetylase RimI-like enzyme